jgi:hypothetical protein
MERTSEQHLKIASSIRLVDSVDVQNPDAAWCAASSSQAKALVMKMVNLMVKWDEAVI